MSYNSEFALSNVKARERNLLHSSFMWMAGALGLTALIAFYVSITPGIFQIVFSNSFGPLILWGIQIALVWYLSSNITKLSIPMAVGFFALYAALLGISLSVIFIIYPFADIAKTFFTTAATFAAMSLYGITTKRDLSTWGNYLFMALIGLIFASVINFFFQSEIFYWLTTYAGVLIFILLTAFDVQKIKNWNAQMGENITQTQFTQLSILGALRIYLDFINLFILLLRILGGRRR